MSINAMSFILGGFLLAVAILGGGIEVRDLKVPSVRRISRLFCAIVGAGFVVLAVYLTPHANGTPSSARKTTPVAPHPVKAEEWLTAAQYQQAFDKHLQDGFYPTEVEGRCESDTDQFHGEWKGIPLGAEFVSHHALTKESYESRNQEYVSKGYSLESLNIFRDCEGIDRYQATWSKTK